MDVSRTYHNEHIDMHATERIEDRPAVLPGSASRPTLSASRPIGEESMHDATMCVILMCLHVARVKPLVLHRAYLNQPIIIPSTELARERSTECAA